MVYSEGPFHTLRHLEIAIMRAFLDEDFLLDSDIAVDLYHRFAEACPSSTSTVICHRSRWRPTIGFARSRRSGWKATTTSGGRCGPTACPSASVRAMPRTGRSSRHGPAPCRTRCAARCTTGRTWSFAGRSGSTPSWGPRPRARCSTSATSACRRTVSRRSASCAASAWRSSARRTTRPTRSRRISCWRAVRIPRRVSIPRGGPTVRWRSRIPLRSTHGSSGWRTQPTSRWAGA